jgi:crotonobetainyl-CoA:carnitine CoA-transferase CaiB-like acyl-CoA transferase
VLDLTGEWGILAGSILADMGADVIHIEPPGGSSARRLGPFAGDSARPEDSLFWASYGRNTRSVALDITSPEGRELLLRLVATADFLLESFRPGYLASLDLSYDRLAAVNPRLIMASITPFGQTGPKAGWPATDITLLASSNYLLAGGDEDRAPLRNSVAQSFLHASAEAAVGCLVALHERRRSGKGQHVDVSAQEALTLCTQSFILSAGWNDVSFFRLPAGQRRGKTGLSGIYPAKDGYVAIGFFFGSALGPLDIRLLEWMHEEGMCDEATLNLDWINYMALLASGEQTFADLERTHVLVERFTRSKTKLELLEGALQRGLLLAPVATTEDVFESTHLRERKFWVHSGTPGDRSLYPGPFAKFSETPLQYRRAAPRIGEHTAEVLSSELGLSGDDLRLLAAAGVV